MKDYEIIIRIVLAIFVGGVVGYEREASRRPAGFRTHILVCVGAAITSMIELALIDKLAIMTTINPALINIVKGDMGRFGAQVITGVGFLGAGTIIIHQGSVKGLTTAASIWTVACIGIAVGFGFYFLSVASLGGVYITLVGLKKFEDRFIDKMKIDKIKVKYYNSSEFIHKINKDFNQKDIHVRNLEYLEEDTQKGIRSCIYTVEIPYYMKNYELLQELSLNDEIISINIL